MRGFVRSLFGQVVIALIVGILLGWQYPGVAVALKPLGDGFIKLIKMLIAPLVFGVVVHGIVGARRRRSRWIQVSSLRWPFDRC